MIVETFDILNLDYLIQHLKYLMSTTFGCKDIGIRKLEFVWQRINQFNLFSNPFVLKFTNLLNPRQRVKIKVNP